jgi:hypothetical protein
MTTVKLHRQGVDKSFYWTIDNGTPRRLTPTETEVYESTPRFTPEEKFPTKAKKA